VAAAARVPIPVGSTTSASACLHRTSSTRLHIPARRAPSPHHRSVSRPNYRAASTRAGQRSDASPSRLIFPSNPHGIAIDEAQPNSPAAPHFSSATQYPTCLMPHQPPWSFWLSQNRSSSISNCAIPSENLLDVDSFPAANRNPWLHQASALTASGLYLSFQHFAKLHRMSLR
jgi:hypothetical protein